MEKKKVGRPKSPYKSKVVSFNVRIDYIPVLRELVKNHYSEWKKSNS